MADLMFAVPLDKLAHFSPIVPGAWLCQAMSGRRENCHVEKYELSPAAAVAAAAAHLAEVHGLGADQPKLSVRFTPDGPDSGAVSIGCGNCLTEQTTRVQFNYPDAETNALLAAAFRNIGHATGWWHD